jgi:alkanesulfonate monooxygenase
MRLTFHWRLIQTRDDPSAAVDPERASKAAGLPDLPEQVAFARRAADLGFESLLTDINQGKPDPMTLALAVALATERIALMVAVRPGLMSPTLFVQQVNTFANLAGGRISLNVVAGHSPVEQRGYGDDLDHAARFARMAEWLSVCRAFWARTGPVNASGRFFRIENGHLNTGFTSPDGRLAPRIFVGGHSEEARAVAAEHADVWLRLADHPDLIREQAAPMIAAGSEVGLRLSVICRDTREEAVEAARSLVEGRNAPPRADSEGAFVRQSDAVSIVEAYALGESEWITPWLWSGGIRTLGSTAVAIVGSPEEVASGFLAFQSAGVSHFVLMGWPSGEEMVRFGERVLPLIRQFEDGPMNPP